MVNIDKVYQRVLFLANKEQRGYITPDEFNSYAELAQLEVFESYFLKKFQTNQAPETTDDYSDVAMNVEEKITFFDNVTSVSSRWDLMNVTQRNASTFKPTSIEAYPYPNDFYRLAQVTINGRMADEVSHKDLTYINLSPLTAPTASQPVFTRHEGGVVVYPIPVYRTDNQGNYILNNGNRILLSGYDGPVNLVYVRKPIQPKWGYLMDPNMAPTYDNRPLTDGNYAQDAFSVDFELHPSDEQELTYKILAMAGITIKQADVSNFAQGKEQQIAATEG